MARNSAAACFSRVVLCNRLVQLLAAEGFPSKPFLMSVLINGSPAWKTDSTVNQIDGSF